MLVYGVVEAVRDAGLWCSLGSERCWFMVKSICRGRRVGVSV